MIKIGLEGPEMVGEITDVIEELCDELRSEQDLTSKVYKESKEFIQEMEK